MKLKDDLAISLDWEVLKTHSPNVIALRALCDECGFHRFKDELGKGSDLEAVTAKAWEANYKTIDNPESFQAFLVELRAQPRFSVDTETTDIDPLRSRLVGLSFSWKAGVAYYLPIRVPMAAARLDERVTLDALRPILTDPAIEKVGQNIKYDLLALGRAGLEMAGPFTDTMILSYLLESGERNHNLDQLSQRLLNHDMIPISDLSGKGKNQLRMDQVDVGRVTEYAAEDADATWRIEAILGAKIREDGLWNLYAELERPLISVLARMEKAGIAVDVSRLKQLSREFAERIGGLETQLFSLAGHTFNIVWPTAPCQVSEELKLPSLSKTSAASRVRLKRCSRNSRSNTRSQSSSWSTDSSRS